MISSAHLYGLRSPNTCGHSCIETTLRYNPVLICSTFVPFQTSDAYTRYIILVDVECLLTFIVLPVKYRMCRRHPCSFAGCVWGSFWCRESVCRVWPATSSSLGGVYPHQPDETVCEDRRRDLWWSLLHNQCLRRHCCSQSMRLFPL